MSPSPLGGSASAGVVLAILLVGACGPGALEPVEYRISVVEGDRQVDSVLAVLPIPLRVQVTDHRNQPAPGVEVRWDAYVVGGTTASFTSLTDAQGIATMAYALGSRIGPNFIAATAAGLPGPPAWFEVTAGPGAAARIHWSFGGDGLGVVGAQMAPYGVHVSDDHGNPISGVTIDWLLTGGGGSVHPAQSVTTPLSATTRHTLGPQGGQQTVLAVATGLPGSPQVTFTATAVNAMIAMISGDLWDCYYYDICASAFLPAVVTISPGQSVGWTWPRQIPCNVVFEDDPTPPVSSTTRSEGTHIRTFTAPGTYRYRCTLRSADFVTGMVGVVVVQ